jgi:predicted AlkP superfamily phosphohydrolase/phosphomutase
MVAGIDWAHTQAFADPVGSTIRLNVAGREPSGTVAPGRETEELLALISQRLLECTDATTGEPAVEAVLRREEVYRGPYVSQAPELTIQWNRRVAVGRLAPSVPGAGDYPTEQFRAISGDHRPEGILMMAGPGIAPARAIAGAAIADVFPTILTLLGIGVPADVDGKVLSEALECGVPGSPPVRASDSPQAPASPGRHEYTSDEEEEIRERLRGLGYLE